jgi:hypothetical protein
MAAMTLEPISIAPGWLHRWWTATWQSWRASPTLFLVAYLMLAAYNTIWFIPDSAIAKIIGMLLQSLVFLSFYQVVHEGHSHWSGWMQHVRSLPWVKLLQAVIYLSMINLLFLLLESVIGLNGDGQGIALHIALPGMVPQYITATFSNGASVLGSMLMFPILAVIWMGLTRQFPEALIYGLKNFGANMKILITGLLASIVLYALMFYTLDILHTNASGWLVFVLSNALVLMLYGYVWQFLAESIGIPLKPARVRVPQSAGQQRMNTA